MSKKKVMIITDRKRIADTIKKDLQDILQDKIDTEILTLNEADNMPFIDGDLFLFTLGNRIERVKKKLSNPDNTMVITRTFMEKEFVKILEIPQNTKVLVVNDNYENTLQTVELLYSLNVNNILMFPYNSEREYDTSIDIAVTPGEADKVPEGISNIIDLGDRHLDLSTFLEIIYRLHISDNDISAKLLNYNSMLINTDNGITKNYKETVMRNIQLERVLDMTDQGVALTLKSGEIVLCNKKFRNLSENPITEGKSNIEDFLGKELKKTLEEKDVSDFPAKINGRDIVLSKNRIIYQKNIYQNIYFFRDITYVKELEETISGQLRAKGFVTKYSIKDIIYKSNKMEKCLESVKIFSKTNKTILIVGQSGTGKELLAQSIHNLSDRRLQPFVAINCAAVPPGLLESELFGYEKGAFTGASREGKAGLFEYANNGTIFLDEIGDMSYELQSRLLRVIQEKQIMRIGSSRVKDINVRIIAATNKDLTKEIEKGNFREDLYYRISVLPVKVPALHERPEDIIPIFKSFLPQNMELGEKEKSILLSYCWPGNVRELKNAAEYYELMHDYDDCLPHKIMESYKESKALPSLENMVFHEINHLFSEGSTVGRETLLNILKENYSIALSEYRLRDILKKLCSEGKIKIYKGRRGIVPITTQQQE